MVPPRWLDDKGRERPTRPCPTCGSPWPNTPPYPLTGWQAYATTNWDGVPGPVFVPEWCGHPRLYSPWQVGADRYVLVEILGEAPW